MGNKSIALLLIVVVLFSFCGCADKPAAGQESKRVFQGNTS